MLSEEKIKKMIRLSDYENGQGSIDLERTKFMKMDYVRFQVIKTILSVAVSGVLVLCLVILYHLEYVMTNALVLPYHTYALVGGSALLAAEAVAIFITCRFASRKYEESKIRVKEYFVTLHDLLDLYEKEEQGQEDNAL
ncbi:MAG: hypothetical protein J1F22_05800 [Lachnospiraceae bacterium]|nr:hypothetical protein [Lachnospiraceae bacterium]